ncbi:MAG: hypothetical protein ACTTJI_05535 [Capnocytophaga sp.]|uniref:hypothetical protein n=1 Tax=Capnocytophaga sp. TaxID=44737 RepID=UPI003FA0492B
MLTKRKQDYIKLRPVRAGKKLVYSTRPSLTIGSTLIVQATDLPKNVTEKQQTL